MTAPPCGHARPDPRTCRWCHLGLRKDRRYGRLWWPEYFRTYDEWAKDRRL